MEPAWLLNLRDDPRVRVEVGRCSFEAVTRIAQGDEGIDLWAGYALLQPTYATYPPERRQHPDSDGRSHPC